MSHMHQNPKTSTDAKSWNCWQCILMLPINPKKIYKEGNEI